mgnify:CR=1 FL=1
MCPLTPLPMPLNEINSNVDAYLCSHVHLDHIGLTPDGKGCSKLDKIIPIYAISRQDADFMEFSGMKDVRIIEDRITYGNSEIIKVKAVHGTIKPCGDACGFVFRSPEEKTLYVAGDTVWCDAVRDTINKYKPDIIITNNCAAMLEGYGRLIMDDEDLAKVCKAAPDAVIIASHMDSVPHATLTRRTLAEKLIRRGIRHRVLIPADGKLYSF